MLIIDFIEFFEIKRFSFSVISTQWSHDLFHDEKLANIVKPLMNWRTLLHLTHKFITRFHRKPIVLKRQARHKFLRLQENASEKNTEKKTNKIGILDALLLAILPVCS